LHSLGVVAKQVRYISTGGRPHQRPCGPPAIEKIIDRYIERTAPARTHNDLRTRFRVFTSWLTEHHPEVTNLAQLTRAQLEEFLTWVPTGYRNYRTGQPVSVSTQVHTISVLNVFLRKTLAWGWDQRQRCTLRRSSFACPLRRGELTGSFTAALSKRDGALH
jgi:hypothetical protein